MNSAFLYNIFKSPPEPVLSSTRLRDAVPTKKYLLKKQWSLILHDYVADIYFNDQKFCVRPGCVSLVPPDTSRQFDFKSRCYHRTSHFRTSKNPKKKSFPPLILDAGKRFDELKKLHDEMAACLLISPTRAKAILWHMLWLTSEFLSDSTEHKQIHPELLKVCEFIDNHLDKSISVEDIVKKSFLSHNQLIRIFHGYFDCSIAAYLRRRRMELAKHLLQSSNLPVKSIAVDVGIPDLQHFNKTVHREFGCSPRKLREK